MTQATNLIQQAIDRSDEEDYEGAIALLQQAIRLDPGHAQAYFERGMAYLNLDRDASAAADFDRALAIDPDFPGALDWRARAAASLGDFQRAAQDRLAALRSRPDGPHPGMGVNPQQWADCADAFICAGEPAQALNLLEEYFKQHEHQVSAYAPYETAPMRVLARLWIDAGAFDSALTLAHKAYLSPHQKPADVLVYALALEADGQLEHARQIGEEALAINDQMPGVRALVDRLGSA